MTLPLPSPVLPLREAVVEQVRVLPHDERELVELLHSITGDIIYHNICHYPLITHSISTLMSVNLWNCSMPLHNYTVIYYILDV